MLDDVYGMTPVNKTSAVVTSQSGCASDDTLSKEQIRQNLVARIKKMEEVICLGNMSKKQRKAFGQEKHELQQQINALRPSRKAPGIENFFIDACRESMTAYQFNLMMDRAGDKMRAASKEGQAQ